MPSPTKTFDETSDKTVERPSIPRNSQSPRGWADDALTRWLLAGVIGYAVVRGLFEAAIRPFWYDELCTWAIVRQGSVSAMWRALSHAVDSQPPPYYWVERLSSFLTNNEQVSFRIPSILGFSCVIFCLYSFIRKKSGGTVALACAMIPLFTLLFDPYSVEARPYSLMVACVSIALVCYQHAPSGRWMILMGASFALAESFHYYSVISLTPFIAAEAVVAIGARRIRWSVWLAFSCALPPLLLFWPLLSRFKAYYGAHFWAMPSLEGAESSYGSFLNTTTTWGLILLFAALLGVMGKVATAGAKGSASCGCRFALRTGSSDRISCSASHGFCHRAFCSRRNDSKVRIPHVNRLSFGGRLRASTDKAKRRRFTGYPGSVFRLRDPRKTILVFV